MRRERPGQPPTTNQYPPQNVSSAGAEKPVFKVVSFGLPNTEKAGSFWKIPWAVLPVLPPPTLDSAKRWGCPGLVVLATSLPITYIFVHLSSILHDSNSEEPGLQSQAARGSDCDNY